jgi:hypothetical protein
MLARLLPLLAVLLALAPHPAGKPGVLSTETSAAVYGRDTLPAQAGDFVTRKNRRAANLEEYLATDDDPDQYAGSLTAAVRTAAHAPVGVERGVRPAYRDPRANHRPSAGLKHLRAAARDDARSASRAPALQPATQSAVAIRARTGRLGGTQMAVLIVYAILVCTLEVGVFFIGLVIDRVVPDGLDLIIAMAMFFGVIWAMWPVAVFIVERWLTPPETAK